MLSMSASYRKMLKSLISRNFFRNRLKLCWYRRKRNRKAFDLASLLSLFRMKILRQLLWKWAQTWNWKVLSSKLLIVRSKQIRKLTRVNWATLLALSPVECIVIWSCIFIHNHCSKSIIQIKIHLETGKKLSSFRSFAPCTMWKLKNTVFLSFNIHCSSLCFCFLSLPHHFRKKRKINSWNYEM